eukprot:5947109-Prymnesium_polylepis.1
MSLISHKTSVTPHTDTCDTPPTRTHTNGRRSFFERNECCTCSCRSAGANEVALVRTASMNCPARRERQHCGPARLPERHRIVIELVVEGVALEHCVSAGVGQLEARRVALPRRSHVCGAQIRVSRAESFVTRLLFAGDQYRAAVRGRCSGARKRCAEWAHCWRK